MQTCRYNEDKGKLLDISRSKEVFGRIAQNFIAFLLIFQVALSQICPQSLTTAVYGGEFGDNFKSAFTSTVVNLAQADLQSLIGDRHTGENAQVNGGEGSVGHVFEHALLGCLAGSALGSTCEAGAVAAAASALYAGAVDPAQAQRDQSQFIANATLLGGLAAAFASGGDTNATMIASGVAGSAFANNYLTHADQAALIQEIKDCEEREGGTCSTASQIIEKYKEISEKRDYELSILCGTDTTCVQNELNSVATTGWDYIEANYSNDFADLQPSIRPGEYANTYISQVYSGIGEFNDTFLREQCGGVFDALCQAKMEQAAIETGALAVVIGGALFLAPEVAAACLANPACTAGLLGAELADMTNCAIDPEPLCALPGPSPTSVAKLADEVVSFGRTVNGSPINFDGQFYSSGDFKFSASYYERLWSNGGRPAPFLQARAIMDSNPIVTPDPRGAVGYFKYIGAGMEMIYNPTTGQVGHIMPIR